MQTMTVEELAALPGVTVGSKEASAVLGCDRYALNIAAKNGELGLQCFFSGNRLKISKASLLEFCGYYSGQGRKPISTIFLCGQNRNK